MSNPPIFELAKLNLIAMLALHNEFDLQLAFIRTQMIAKIPNQATEFLRID